MKFKLVSIIVLFVSLSLFAQYEDDLALRIDSYKKTKDWEPGYIVTKTFSDTIKGFVKIKTSTYHEVMKVSYKNNIDDKRHKYDVSSDSIRRFGYAGKHYKYMYYTDTASSPKKRKQNSVSGWAEILVTGDIVLSRGICNESIKFDYAPTMGPDGMITSSGLLGRSVVPCFCLRKRTEPTVIITMEPKLFNYFEYDLLMTPVSDKTKERVLKMIGDYPSLASEWGQKQILNNDIMKIVSAYNKRSK